MITATLEEVKNRGLKKVGVLGLGKPVVYTNPLDSLGIAYETVSGELRDRLDRSILALMEGRAGPEECHAAERAVEALQERGVDGTILGCTEIPLLLAEGANRPHFINPAQLLAEAAVRYAIE